MDRYDQTGNIAVLGMLSNTVLLCLKLAAGFITGSQAMLADGFNSAGDVFASAMTFAGNKIARRPEDKTHPFGHGKAEYIFSMIISFSLLIVAYKILTGSIEALLGRHSVVFSWWLAAIAAFTIALKLFLFLYSRKSGMRDENLLVLANSEDHRNDIFVSASTLVATGAGFLGVTWLDGAAGIGISLWITFTGLRIFRSAYLVLMDTNVDNLFQSRIEEAVSDMPGIDHIDEIIAKPIGISYLVILKISVNGSMTVKESHKIAAAVRRRVRVLKKIRDVIVHINPT